MIRRARTAPAPEGDEAPEYWITYSDLMVSLLMVFALLLFVALARIEGITGTATATTSAIGNVLVKADASQQVFVFDTVTGTLRMKEEVLFDYGRAELKPEAQAFLRTFARSYVPKLLDDVAIDSMLEAIEVEGHTDTVGTYMSNLRLSQDRAYAVMRTMVEATYGMPRAERFRTLVVASGRSETEPLHDASGGVDAARSRRIEVRFRVRTDAILRRIATTMASAAPPSGTGR
jgi:chemotaxis protein MotB